MQRTSRIRVKNLQICDDEVWCGQTQHVWVDVEAPSPEQVEELKRYFSFNKLALEDVLGAEQWSCFERYPEHLFLIFNTLAEPEDLTELVEELDIFWFPDERALVTFHHGPIVYLEAVWNRVNNFPERTPINILYNLLQRGTETFFTFLDELEIRTEDLEEHLLDSLSQGAAMVSDVRAQPFCQKIFALRRAMISARKSVSDAREYVTQFARHSAELSSEAGIYLSDVADHLTRVYGGLDAAGTVIDGLHEVYLSVESQRLNEVIRTLTTVSTIFLPLTFLAGVWGMNFEYEPEFGWRYGYLFAWASFLVISGISLWYFKRKKWW